MGPQPGNYPQVPAETISPALFPRIADKFEPAIHIQGSPLVVGYVVTVKVDDLLIRQRLPITDVLYIHLYNFKRLGGILVNELSILFAGSVASETVFKSYLVPSQDVPDGTHRHQYIRILLKIP